MKLTVLGCGTFFVTKDQTASAYLLELAGKKILIDCGPGTLVRLSEEKVKLGDLDFVFLTHFHPDHTSDLFPLIMNYRLADFTPGQVTNFPRVFGPTGISQFVFNYSHLSQLPALDTWDKIKFHDYQQEIKFDNFTIKTFPVDHVAFGIKAQAYSLRFESENKTIVFSGDSTNCQGVRDACIGADVFVCDTSYPKGQGNQAHMDTVDIGNICQSGEVKKVLLTHFYPQYADSDFVSEIKEDFSGEVESCHDGMKIEI